MTDSNKPLRLPIDPFLYNASDMWWKKYKNDYDDPTEYYSRYQDWMREQGVIIRDINSIAVDDQGIDFVDESSMLMFILRWSN
jgi:hypothetical protein